MSKGDFYQVSLKIFLKNQNGEVLVLKAVSNGSMAGFYDLPGGRIDEDEFRTPFAEIMGRELKEEIGGDVKIKMNPTPPLDKLGAGYRGGFSLQSVGFADGYLKALHPRPLGRGITGGKINPRPVAMGRHLVPAHLARSKEKDLHVLYLFFEAEYLSGNIAISTEHESYRWIGLAKEDVGCLFTSGILEGVKMYLMFCES